MTFIIDRAPSIPAHSLRYPLLELPSASRCCGYHTLKASKDLHCSTKTSGTHRMEALRNPSSPLLLLLHLLLPSLSTLPKKKHQKFIGQFPWRFGCIFLGLLLIMALSLSHEYRVNVLVRRLHVPCSDVPAFHLRQR